MTTIHHGPGVAGPGGLGAGATDKTATAQHQSSHGPTPSQPGASSQPDSVEITPTAQLLANATQQIAASADIDQGRVDAIRQALASGSYHVDASRVADGLLAAQKADAQAATGPSHGPQSSTAKAFAATAQLGSEPS